MKADARSRPDRLFLATGQPQPQGEMQVKYMLLIYGDEKALRTEEREACYHESTGLAHQLSAAGQYVAASPLQPAAAAKSVRVRAGERQATDGRLAEPRDPR